MYNLLELKPEKLVLLSLNTGYICCTKHIDQLLTFTRDYQIQSLGKQIAAVNRDSQ